VCVLAAGPVKEALQPYVAFHAALRSAHVGFVSRLDTQARTLLRHHLDTATSEFALSLLMSTVSLEPAAAYQQQAAVMPPPGSRRAAAAAAADEGENVPPQDDASDEGQVRLDMVVARVQRTTVWSTSMVGSSCALYILGAHVFH
jgi:hypothetical protein